MMVQIAGYLCHADQIRVIIMVNASTRDKATCASVRVAILVKDVKLNCHAPPTPVEVEDNVQTPRFVNHSYLNLHLLVLKYI